VYSAIGATQPNTYENSNHNNNLSFIVTTDGVLVFNAGGSYLVAQALHDEIRSCLSNNTSGRITLVPIILSFCRFKIYA
jgi:hypothetical protein